MPVSCEVIVATREVIKKIIETKELDQLIGLREGLYFDAKEKNGYNLDTSNGRYELAKDVSSFANAAGGLLMIGLNTEPLIGQKTEKVRALIYSLNATSLLANIMESLETMFIQQ